jgi:hypothetical protein
MKDGMVVSSLNLQLHLHGKRYFWYKTRAVSTHMLLLLLLLQVALLLKQVYSGQEAALMQQLEPDAAPQPCAAVLLRWMAAAAKE